jgi:hypothetical protein
MVAGKYSLQNLITYDPAEHSVVDLEVEPSADYVMSGDRHLLQLGACENTTIFKSDRFTIVPQELRVWLFTCIFAHERRDEREGAEHIVAVVALTLGGVRKDPLRRPTPEWVVRRRN